MDSKPFLPAIARPSSRTLAQRFATPTAHLQAWSQFAKPIIAYIKKLALSRPARNTDIRDFFLPSRHTPTHPDAYLGGIAA
jgi:hypothetical protein